MERLRCIIWTAVSTRAQNEPDKFSLPQQEEDARKVARSNGWKVVDILRVPGHSRRFLDFQKLIAAANKKNIHAFARLDEHLKAKDFDVMVVLDGNRFGRTQALHAYITESAIDAGARIYSLLDGWVDKKNYRMWIAMNGYKAAGEVDRLVMARDMGMYRRAEKGMAITSRTPISHLSLREEKTGKSLPLIVDESKRRLWNDLAALILEGVPWEKIEIELFERYGHVNKNGKPYYINCMYQLITKPLFWGHTARHYNSPTSKNGYKKGRWIYDETEPVPDGVTIYRNTHPAVWTGELADRVRQELDRRKMLYGNADPNRTHRLSGLLVCGECGSFMATTVHRKRNYRGLLCPAAKGRPGLPPCSNKGCTSEKEFIRRIDELLRQMLHDKGAEIFTQKEDQRQAEIQERLQLIAQDVAKLEEQVRTLIRKQSTAPEEVQVIFDEEIEKLSEQIKNLRDTEKRLKGESLTVKQSSVSQQATLQELANLTLEQFWLQESRKINQLLHRLMGTSRFIAFGGKIIGVAEVQRKQRRHS